MAHHQIDPDEAFPSADGPGGKYGYRLQPPASRDAGPQSMSVKELGSYQSSDYPDKTMDQVAKQFGRDRLRSDRVSYNHGMLKNDIRENGIQEPVEVDTVNHIYGQGHHRYVAARSLRLKEIPVVHKDMG
jgi:hypothetical protein